MVIIVLLEYFYRYLLVARNFPVSFVVYAYPGNPGNKDPLKNQIQSPPISNADASPAKSKIRTQVKSLPGAPPKLPNPPGRKLPRLSAQLPSEGLDSSQPPCRRAQIPLDKFFVKFGQY
jgi:hypothetical protein